MIVDDPEPRPRSRPLRRLRAGADRQRRRGARRLLSAERGRNSLRRDREPLRLCRDQGLSRRALAGRARAPSRQDPHRHLRARSRHRRDALSARRRAGQGRAADADLGAFSARVADRRRPYQRDRRADMSATVAGVTLLPTDGQPAGPPVDLAHRRRRDRRDRAGGRAAVAAPPRPAGARQRPRSCRAAVADLVRRGGKAARDLAPASRGDAADRPLSRRARRLRPGGARRRGLGHGALHPLPRPDAAGRGSPRDRPRGAEVGVRVTLAVFMRDRNPLVYGPPTASWRGCRTPPAPRSRRSSFAPRRASRSRSHGSRRSRRAVESPTFAVQFGPNGPQWCSDDLLAAIAERSAETGRRVHMHLWRRAISAPSPTTPIPRASVARLRTLGLLTPRLTLAHCVCARGEDLDAIAASRRDHRDQPELEPASCAAASRPLARRSSAAAGSRSASTPRPSTRTTISCARCGSAISCTAAGASRAIVTAQRLVDQQLSPTGASPMARRAMGAPRRRSRPIFSCSISTRSTATR